jgi:hypothetical protein
MYKTTMLNGCSKYDGLLLLGSNMSKRIGSIITSGHLRRYQQTVKDSPPISSINSMRGVRNSGSD